jgi:LysR family glycine cleavage system transcriptional activator
MEIRWGHGQWPGLVSQRLTWDTLFPVCSPDLMAKSPLTVPADVSNHPLLHVLGYEEGWGYWLNMVGAHSVDFSTGMQFDTLISTLRMAELGQGIALARSSMVDDMLRDGRLVEPFTQRIDASESFYLVRDSGAEQHPDAAIFSTWLVEQAHRFK